MLPALAALACLTAAGCDAPAPRRNQADSFAPSAEATPPQPADASSSVFEPPSVSVMQPSVINETEPAAAPPPPAPFAATVQFDSGAVLDDAAKATLAGVIAAAAKAPDDPITIRGSTDSQGDDAQNRRMSMKRAEAVRDYLAAQGIREERMTTIALGETRPVAPNALLDGADNEAGRQRNRRADILVGGAAEPNKKRQERR